RGDADERSVRLERERLLDAADHRHARAVLAGPAGVEDRGDAVAPVAEDAPHRLSVVRVAGEALREDQVPHRAGETPSPGASGASWTPSRSSTPGHGSCRMRRLPSRSTWS